MSFLPNYAVHPGKILQEQLKRSGMTQLELSQRTGISEKHLSQIIQEKASITGETAIKLEVATGGSASFWLNAEKQYQETLARLEYKKTLQSDAEIVSKYPYNELVKRGLVKLVKTAEEKVEQLRSFFGVNSLYSVEQTEAIAFRTTGNHTISKEALAAWLRCGEIGVKNEVFPEFNKQLLKSRLPELKSISRSIDLAYCTQQIKEILRGCGVAFSFDKYFDNIAVNGASRWIGDTPLVQLNDKGKYIDIFWFTLFHEIGHIVLHGKKDEFLEDKAKDSINIENVDKEKEADEFARDSLIPPSVYRSLIAEPMVTVATVQQYAEKAGLHSSVIVGRLAKEGHIQWNTANKTSLRERFQ